MAWTSYQYPSPDIVGQYRLTISYNDPENKYYANDAYVYYEITPQYVTVDPATKEYTVIAGTSVQDFVEGLYEEFIGDVYKITVDNAAGTYIPTDKIDKYSGDLTELTQSLELAVIKDNASVAEGEFVAGAAYDLEINYWNYNGGYVNYNDTVLYNAKPVIKVVEPTIAIDIKVDASKLNPELKESVYDGTVRDIKVADIVTVIGADGKEIADFPKDKLEYRWYNNNYDGYTDEVKNVGEYYLEVSFAGDETYKPDTTEANQLITIKKAPLTVTPNVKENIVAGISASYGSNIVVDDTKDFAVFEGVAEADKDAFVYGYYNDDDQYISGYKAFSYSDYSVDIIDKDGDYFYNRLRSNTTYKAKFSYLTLYSPYDNNYEVTYAEKEFTPIRDYARVTPYYDNAAINVTKNENYSQTIVPADGVPYSYDTIPSYATGEDLEEGNWFIFYIYAPDEYSGSSELSKSVVYKNSIESAGGHILDHNISSAYNPYIKVAFNAKDKDTKKFEIRWAQDAVETFTVDMTNAILEYNLEDAVAPKTIAFNNAPKKMVVGDNVALDVKLTKVQINDIIKLGYSVSDEKVLTVTSEGYLTALNKGTAEVEVYPVHMVDGELVRIEGAKSAKAKITVNDVSVAAIKKVTATDTAMTVQFASPKDGYRVEFYVMEGNKSAEDFKTAIASMRNGIWKDIFAIAPYYEYNNDINEKTYTQTLSGLSSNSEYTVCIRNVSGIREENGAQVVASEAYSVKAFTTTKAQMKAFDIDVDSVDGKTSYDEEVVDLSVKTLQASAWGYFNAIDEDKAADKDDTQWIKLPLTKEQQNSYVNPKVSYYVLADDTGYYKKTSYYSVKIGNAYYPKSSIATINGKGKITLKGVGTAYVCAYDKISDTMTSTYITITSKADAISAKTGKVKVGQGIGLTGLLEYKYEGKKVLFYNYEYANLAYETTDCDDYYIYGNTLYAKRAGNFEVKATDIGINKDVTINIKATAIDPVKKLKAVDVVDKWGSIQFTYPSTADNVVFSIDLKDSKGNVITNYLVHCHEMDRNYSNGAYTYKHTLNGLTLLSSYKVSVTAIYGNAVSKTVTTNMKTTNIPASYTDLGNSYGGTIYVKYKDYGKDLNNISLISGNTYTLFIDDNYSSTKKVTDTLTWKSSNPKVASVKAIKGSYSAEFKALSAGSTTIEVTSKITKKVIARYNVWVNTVGSNGSGNDGYFGDFDPNGIYALPKETTESLLDTLNRINDILK